MKQTSQPFAYEQLRSLSFTDMFQLFFMIARRTWFRNLEWANESDDRLSSQPHRLPGFRTATKTDPGGNWLTENARNTAARTPGEMGGAAQR